MEWPERKPDGKYVTTSTAKDVWKATMMAASASTGEHQDWIDSVDACRNWRTGYIPVVQELITIMAAAEPEETIRMAEAGLEKLQNVMMFRCADDNLIPAVEAFGLNDSSGGSIANGGETTKFETSEFFGSQDGFREFPLASPTGEWLSGAASTGKQLRAYADYGCIEESAAHHAGAICSMENCGDVVKDKYFVLLGVTSEMGPTKSLLQMPGAQVLGVARKGKRLNALIDWFKETGAKDACLRIPGEGADLLKEGPQIAQWIVNTVPQGREIVLCMLCYMDGEAHVRVSVAVDLIMSYVAKNYQGKVSLSFLPGTGVIYTIPPEAAESAKQRYKSQPLWQYMSAMASLGYWLKPTNVWKNENRVMSGASSVQGPNYLLAKTMQQWRCMVAYWKDNLTVSTPYAPATRTASMVRYATIANAIEGFQMIKPLVSFDVDQTSSLMAAVMLYQVSNASSSGANPANKQAKHPMQIFWDGAVHGGAWYCPYTTDSISTLSYLMGRWQGGKYVPKKLIVEDY